MLSHPSDVAADARQPGDDVRSAPSRPVKGSQAAAADDAQASRPRGRISERRTRSFAENNSGVGADVSTGSPVMSLWKSMDPNGSLSGRLNGQGEGSGGWYSSVRDSAPAPALVPKRPSSARPLLSSANVRARPGSSGLRIKVPADVGADTSANTLEDASAASLDSPSSLGGSQMHQQEAVAPPPPGGAQHMVPDRSPPGTSAQRGGASGAAAPARASKHGGGLPLSPLATGSRSPSVSPTAHPLGASGTSSANQSPLACTASDQSKDYDSSPPARSPDMTSAASSTTAELMSRSGSTHSSTHSNTSGGVQKSPAREEKPTPRRPALARLLRSFHEVPSSGGADVASGPEPQGGSGPDRTLLQAQLSGRDAPYQPSVRDIGTASDSSSGALRAQQRPHDLVTKGGHRPSQSLTGLALVDGDSLSALSSPSGVNSDTMGRRTGMRAVLAKWQKYQSLMESSSSRSGSPSSYGSDSSPRLPQRQPRGHGVSRSHRMDLPTSILSLCQYSESALVDYVDDEPGQRSNGSDCCDFPEPQSVRSIRLLYADSARDGGGSRDRSPGYTEGVPGLPERGRNSSEEEGWRGQDSAAIAARAARLFRERARHSFKRRMARGMAADGEGVQAGDDLRPPSPSAAEVAPSAEQLPGAAPVLVSRATSKDNSSAAAADQFMDAWRSLETVQGPGSPHANLHRRRPSVADEAVSSSRDGQAHEPGSLDSGPHSGAPVDTEYTAGKNVPTKDYSSARLYKQVTIQAALEKHHLSEGRDRGGGGAKEKDNGEDGYAVKRAEDLEKVLRLPSHKGTMSGRGLPAVRRSVVPTSADSAGQPWSRHADHMGRYKANSDKRGRGDWPRSKQEELGGEGLRERVRGAEDYEGRNRVRLDVERGAASAQRAKQHAAAKEASRRMRKVDAISVHSDRGRHRPRLEITPDQQLREIRALLRPLCNSLSHSAHILGKPYKDIHASFAFHRRELGAGRFGVIRKCKELSTGKVYACKTISKSEVTCIEDAEDVRTEIACLTMLRDCPSVVNMKGTYEDPESVHIIMELCQGGDLCDRIAEKGCLGEGDAARLIASLATALIKCHSLGIMHRDVKPENVLLVSRDSDWDMKLVDFGVSCLFEPGKKLDAVAGTVEFMAPEVLDESYGPEADIWSAGVLLHIALSGVQPFWASSRDALLQCIREKEIAFRSARWAKISEGGKDLVEKMLQKNPLKRISGQEILRHPWVVTHTRQASAGPSIARSPYSPFASQTSDSTP